MTDMAQRAAQFVMPRRRRRRADEAPPSKYAVGAAEPDTTAAPDVTHEFSRNQPIVECLLGYMLD
jgi:hypothetical protein